MPRATSTKPTVSQPTSQSPASPALPSSAAPAWLPSTLTTVSSTLLALWATTKVAAFLPQALAPAWKDGKVATELLAWAPFTLTLLALVAIASPVSLAPLVSLVRSVWPGKAPPPGSGE